MSRYKYSSEELEMNKILKMNQDISRVLLNDNDFIKKRKITDDNISSSMKLLQELNIDKDIVIQKNDSYKKTVHQTSKKKSWGELVEVSNDFIESEVHLEDLLDEVEIGKVRNEFKIINQEFSRQVSILNQTDLAFLSIATAIQVIKAQLFPLVAEKMNYGEKFNSEDRISHNDKKMEQNIRKSKDQYRDKHMKNNKTENWIELVYQSVPYDISRGSKDINFNMGGKYHRLYTLGHDPILGWIFGTANILTDTITFNTLQTNKIVRNPYMKITSERVALPSLLNTSYKKITEHKMNLPAAVFAQAMHLKSDAFTKIGLPIPMLSTINEEFANKLYRDNYDTLAFTRDIAIVGGSVVISRVIDMIIGLMHGLFKKEGESSKMYEARTRKILLISNSIASTSSVITTAITKNKKNLDIGSLMNTVAHLFTDSRFITRLKQEYIEREISEKLQIELDKIDELYYS